MIWVDTTTQITREDLLWKVKGDDLPLVLLWLRRPDALTDDERERLDEIIARVVAEKAPNDTRVTYRWVDNRTGEVDT